MVPPQGPVIGPILFLIYVNDLPDRLSADSLPYVDDVKLIAPRNRHDILQNSLNISASWSRDWELDIIPTTREHLHIGNSPISSLTPSRPIITQHPDHTNSHKRLVRGLTDIKIREQQC